MTEANKEETKAKPEEKKAELAPCPLTNVWLAPVIAGLPPDSDFVKKYQHCIKA